MPDLELILGTRREIHSVYPFNQFRESPILLGAKHGDSGLDNSDWQDSCLEEQTVGTVGRALCVLVSDFLAKSL
jgi:hypothetical protein